MALESFYGGKPGFSPVIKAKFKYINSDDPAYQAVIPDINSEDYESKKSEIALYTMDECFKNPSYTDVWYGELCIIDTDNKMNPNNGKLYRRTLKKNNDDAWTSAGNTTYAEYIGQIVGPSGGIPNLDLGGLTAERMKAVGEAPTIDTDPDRFENISNWEYAYPGSNGKISTATPLSYETIQVLDAGGIEGSNIEMVPGKDENKFNDIIKYTWCNVRRTSDNSDVNAWFYLGFQIPYTVFDINVIEEDFTYGQDLENEKVFIDNSNPSHPFYKNYEFHIPAGAPGIGPEEIFIVKKENPLDSSITTLYNYDAIYYNSQMHKYVIDSNKIKNISNLPASYWVGKWRIFNSKEEPNNNNIIYVYLGSYKEIDSIEVNTDKTNSSYGKIKIDYSDESSYSKTLPLIKNFSVDTNTGKINIRYADGTNEDSLGSINAIKQTWIDENGHLLIWYTSPEYRPSNLPEGNLPEGEKYYRQSSNVGNKYSNYLNWVMGTVNNPIAETTNIWWHDLGEVRKTFVAPKIVTSHNGNGNTINQVINDLNNNYPNGNVNGTEGGLIAANNVIKDGVVATRIFYYNDSAGTWIDLGILGTSGGGSSSSDGSIFYIEGPKSVYNENDDNGKLVLEENEHITYPLDNMINPEFYFTSSQRISQINNSDIYAPSGSVDSFAVLGNGIYLFDTLPV